MVSLKSHPNKVTTGVDLVDHRSTLYYGKYQFRARLTLDGLNRTYFAKNFLEYEKVIDRNKKKTSGKRRIELDKIDMAAIERYINWRNTNKDNKTAMIRVEGNTAGVFSNDLQLLKTLEQISPGTTVDYTEVDQSIPQGTKYYVKQPKHNYRVYLKSKRVSDEWKKSLSRFFDRYKDSDTVVVPSNALDWWLKPDKPTNTWYWNTNYCSSHYYIDFDEQSTDTLFALMFGDMISKRLKLEKRPDPV
jgi:hypothetical protein